MSQTEVRKRSRKRSGLELKSLGKEANFLAGQTRINSVF